MNPKQKINDNKNNNMNANNTENQSHDEFGRDLTLKAQAELMEYVILTYFTDNYYNRYKGMSWAEIEWLEEEEEEEAKRKLETDQLKKTLSARKELHNQGLYELEEGEELEL